MSTCYCILTIYTCRHKGRPKYRYGRKACRHTARALFNETVKRPSPKLNSEMQAGYVIVVCHEWCKVELKYVCVFINRSQVTIKSSDGKVIGKGMLINKCSYYTWRWSIRLALICHGSPLSCFPSTKKPLPVEITCKCQIHQANSTIWDSQTWCDNSEHHLTYSLILGHTGLHRFGMVMLSRASIVATVLHDNVSHVVRIWLVPQN
jgi:hypothetical protein